MEPTDSTDPLDDLGTTALGVAYIRARESDRPEPLFRDPLAQAFIDAVPGSAPQAEAGQDPVAELGPTTQVLIFGARVRTRFFDEYLWSAAAAGCRQLVILAAGLDARAFRFEWPDGVRLFEVDRPVVLAFKDRVLREQAVPARCLRVGVPANLAEDWAGPLAEAGFDPAAPTAWLAEGLLTYLTAEEAAGLLGMITDRSAPGSRLSFEQYSLAPGSTVRQMQEVPELSLYASLWKGGLGERTLDWLAERGWQTRPEDVRTVGESYGLPAPAAEVGDLVTAIRS
jgi:methyltransferase (TIGR00027 family)